MGSAAITAIAEYHDDVDRSLRLYFSNVSPSFSRRFLGLRPEEIQAELIARLQETDQRSAFFILTTLEAAFRVDYECRCQKRMKDDLSRAFRRIWKSRKLRVNLEDDLFELWRESIPKASPLISELRGAFKFRHWLAHGRFWKPKLGRSRYDFSYTFDLAKAVFNSLPLQRPD